MPPPTARVISNTATLLLGAAFAITLWDCGHSVFEGRAERATGIFVTLGALVLACLASAFAVTARVPSNGGHASEDVA